MKKIYKKNPFKTPDSYFEEFSDSLSTRLREESVKLPKKGGFALPDGYLDGLHSSIQEKLEPKGTKVVPLNPYRRYYLAAASIAALMLMIIGINWNTTKQNASWEDIANTDIENYFENNAIGLSSYEIAEVIAVDGLEISNFLDSQLSEEHILDYLNERTDDYEELNLEEDE